MIKKTILIVAGGALVLTLIFGSRLVPYAKTTIKQIRQRAQDAVPISTQIETARSQLKDVDTEVKNMMMNVAKEEVGLRTVRNRLDETQGQLERQHAQIIRLKDHLESGEEVYTARGRAYPNSRVRDELKSLFRVYKTTERTVSDLEKTLAIREQGLEAAKKQLEETIAQRHELSVEIENLVARKQMVDVAKTASKLSLDDSQLSEAREMIQEIATRIDVEAQMLQLVPEYVGSLPCEDDPSIDEDDGDIVEEINTYFDGESQTVAAAR
jgi:chromosome segregation ATPase